MAPKRKAATKSTTTSKKKQRTSSFTRSGTFRLLDLAPELRNEIYAYVLQNEPQAYLKSGRKNNLVSKSALSRVNRQVRKEFNSLVQVDAPQLVVEVKNFNFGHVITYLNSLDHREIETLATSVNTAGRLMIVSLTVTEQLDHGWWVGWQKVDRWLKRFDQPEKTGAHIEYTYRALRTPRHVAKELAEYLEPNYGHIMTSVANGLSKRERESGKMASAFDRLARWRYRGVGRPC